MLIGFLITAATGLLCIVIGALLCFRKQITLLHRYHYEHVRPEHIRPFTRLMGIGMLLIGAGILVTGIAIFLLHRHFCYIPFATCTASAVILFLTAHLRYSYNRPPH